MTDLHAAILARLDELDADARSAMTYTTGEWTVVPGGSMVDIDCRDISVDGSPVIVKADGWESLIQTNSDPFVAEHIVAFRPPVALGITAAIRTVLDLHPADRDHMCIKDIAGYSVQAWYDDEPCPTILAIAEKLGIET